MIEISRRDFFAATANVDWIKTSPSAIVALICDINDLPPTPTDGQKALFYVKAEIKWRWRYSGLMLSGKGDS